MALSSDYLKPQWQKKRLEIMSRDEFKCVICGSEEKTLHVHHKYYIKGRKVWDYDNSILETLCCDCHKEKHSEDIIKKSAIELIEKTFKVVDKKKLLWNVGVLCLKMLNKQDENKVNIADLYLGEHFEGQYSYAGKDM